MHQLKLKKHLYTTLIRPILEYPAIQLDNTTITNKRTIQRVQNSATRFISNTKLIDRVSSEQIHNNINMQPMNIRRNKLAIKQLNKIHDTYYSENLYTNKSTDYEITDPPKHEKQQTLFQKIEEFIYADPSNCPWHNPLPVAEWTPPNPLYTIHYIH